MQIRSRRTCLPRGINPAMELGSLKFRVSREEFADSVAWVARSLPSRPPVPVLGGVLLDATEAGLTVSGFPRRSASRQMSRLQVRHSSPTPPCRYHQVASQQAGRCDPRGHSRAHLVRKRQVLCPRCRSRTTPASDASAAVRVHSRRPVLRSHQPGSRCSRQGRHPSDAQGYPCRDRTEFDRPRRYRPLPSRCS